MPNSTLQRFNVCPLYQNFTVSLPIFAVVYRLFTETLPGFGRNLGLPIPVSLPTFGSPNAWTYPGRQQCGTNLFKEDSQVAARFIYQAPLPSP